MIHRVKLSNGEVLLIKEEDHAVSIADAEPDGTVRSYICQISPDGVLVYPNSGCSCEVLVDRLPVREQPDESVA